MVAVSMVVVVAVLALSGCAGAGSESPTDAGPSASAGDITVADVWVRAAPAAGNSAAYAVIRNAGTSADRLQEAHADVAGMVQIHETVMEGDVARMVHQPDGIALPAGSSVSLEPGGLHIMLMGLTADLVEGETTPLTLVFETAGSLTVDAPVRTSEAGDMEMGGS